MARLPTTFDSFAAVAEPKRREVLGLLTRGERQVNDIADLLGWPQPQVSKHLGVLLQVGLVNVRRDGRQRLYCLNGNQIKPIRDWADSFERFWDHQLDRIKQRAESKDKNPTNAPKKNPPNQERT